MANFLDIVNKKMTSTELPKIDPAQLSIQELEFLLNTLKTCTFRGDQIEIFYNLVVKLQTQYIALTSKK